MTENCWTPSSMSCQRSLWHSLSPLSVPFSRRDLFTYGAALPGRRRINGSQPSVVVVCSFPPVAVATADVMRAWLRSQRTARSLSVKSPLTSDDGVVRLKGKLAPRQRRGAKAPFSSEPSCPCSTVTLCSRLPLPATYAKRLGSCLGFL